MCRTENEFELARFSKTGLPVLAITFKTSYAVINRGGSSRRISGGHGAWMRGEWWSGSEAQGKFCGQALSCPKKTPFLSIKVCPLQMRKLCKMKEQKLREQANNKNTGR